MIMIMSDTLNDLFIGSPTVTAKAGGILFHSGDSVTTMFLVQSGQIDLVRFSPSGTRLILHSASAGTILAEASAYSSTYHCDGQASTDVTAKAMPVSDFRDRLHASEHLAHLWAAQLASTLQKARMQSEIRTLKTVAERLDAWMIDNPELPPKGKQQDLANILGVTREALYRELAKRRIL